MNFKIRQKIATETISKYTNLLKTYDSKIEFIKRDCILSQKNKTKKIKLIEKKKEFANSMIDEAHEIKAEI